MKKKFLWIIAAIFLGGPCAWSQGIFLQGGIGVHAEDTVNPALKQGVGYGSLSLLLQPNEVWGFQEEVNFLKNSSSSGNVRIEYTTWEWNQWAQWSFGASPVYRPHLLVGGGISQDQVKTTFGTVSRNDKSRVYFNAAVGAGLSAHWWDSWSMTAQVRLWKYEQKKDMTLSGLFLVGYRF